MTDIETRLRQELRAEAERVTPGHLRPLGIPPGRRVKFTAKWLAPAAAAATVAATIAGVMVGVPATGLSGARPGAHAAGQPAWTPADRGMPRYYVTLTIDDRAAAFVANVHGSLTGEVLSRVLLPQAPGGIAEVDISAAADDRTFAIEEESGVSPTAHLFYLLRIGPGGRSASLRRLPLTRDVTGRGALLRGISLSPDGTRLAMTIESGGRPIQQTAIKVAWLATGETRTWTARVRVSRGAFGADSPSWGPGGRVLAFLRDDKPRGGLFLLDTRAPGGSLNAARQFAPASPAAVPEYPALMAAGNTVITETEWPSHPNYGVVSQLSLRTGRLLRVLYGPPRYRPTQVDVLSADLSGQHVLVIVGGIFGRVDHGTFTRLPFTRLPLPLETVAW